MAKNIVDTCIICEQVACRCGKPEKKVAPRKPRAKKEAAVPPPAVPQPVAEQPPSIADPFDGAATVKRSARDAMRARAGRSRTPQPVVTTVRAQPTSRQSDPIMDAAIVALAPILAPDEKAKHKDILWTNSEAGLRALAWRQRRTDAG